MKSHTTVKITEKLLRDSYCACETGLNTVAHLLPANVSTDPERNFDLAEALVETYGGIDQLGWLLVQTSRGSDPYWVAQHLAAIADHIATARGR